MIKELLRAGIIGMVVLGFSIPAMAKDKFELEFEKDQEAVKLVRDTKAGGYEVISTEELKKLIDSKKDILIVDTMPYEDSYKKEHVPGAKQFLFPIPIMENWDAKETGGKSLGDFAAFLGPDKDKTNVFYCGFVKCTRNEVRAEVLERCWIFSRGGGYIFNAIHCVQANTPVENVVAMLDAVKEFNGTT